jgi:hypothetical protein
LITVNFSHHVFIEAPGDTSLHESALIGHGTSGAKDGSAIVEIASCTQYTRSSINIAPIKLSFDMSSNSRSGVYICGLSSYSGDEILYSH